MAKSHRMSYVWLSCSGCVMGITVEELNSYITMYNKLYWLTGLTFWEYLSYELDTEIHGLSVLWNKGNGLVNQLRPIKEAAHV